MTREEQIKMASEIIAHGCSDELEAALIQDFPELKESEDERTLKGLKGLVKNAYECGRVNCDKEMYDTFIAYLEKQKEQNVVPSRETILGIWELGNLWKENIEERDGLTQLQYIQKYWFEKNDYQKEQKPVEQNSVSGDSEKPNNHAGWSEKDDALLKEIVSFFKDGSVKLQHDLDLYAGFLENKFKSLSPQSHWKPSEEQMGALNYAYCELFKREDVGHNILGHLQKLIDQLSKLM